MHFANKELTKQKLENMGKNILRKGHILEYTKHMDCP